MSLTVVAIILSCLVAIIQIWSFFDSRNEKKYNKLSVFSKAADVKADLDNMKKIVDTKIIQIDITANLNKDILNSIGGEVLVLKERVSNEIRNTEKLLDKLEATNIRVDAKIDQLQKDNK